LTREQLAHILRAACRIVDDPKIVVLGSQAILGAYPEDSLPAPVTLSVEADLAFFGDDDHRKSDLIDAMIGEEPSSIRPSPTTARAFRSGRPCSVRGGRVDW
jgi:hypothetical protein